ALTPLQRTTTDLRDFVSPGLPALHDLDTLESATGAGGEVDVLVDSTANVASPEVVSWMLAAERRLQALVPAGSPQPVSLVDLLALGAVAVVLLLTTLSGWRALVALVPMTLATGWTTLVVVALRIQVTPITAVLGALVVALATEFSVIWSTRFREARRDG